MLSTYRGGAYTSRVVKILCGYYRSSYRAYIMKSAVANNVGSADHCTAERTASRKVKVAGEIRNYIVEGRGRNIQA